MFPINVTIDEIDITATGKSQNARAAPTTYFVSTSSTVQFDLNLTLASAAHVCIL